MIWKCNLTVYACLVYLFQFSFNCIICWRLLPAAVNKAVDRSFEAGLCFGLFRFLPPFKPCEFLSRPVFALATRADASSFAVLFFVVPYPRKVTGLAEADATGLLPIITTRNLWRLRGGHSWFGRFCPGCSGDLLRLLPTRHLRVRRITIWTFFFNYPVSCHMNAFAKSHYVTWRNWSMNSN